MKMEFGGFWDYKLFTETTKKVHLLDSAEAFSFISWPFSADSGPVVYVDVNL